MTGVLRCCGRTVAATCGSGSSNGRRRIRPPSLVPSSLAFVCLHQSRRYRTWSSFVENIAPPPPVKAFIEGNSFGNSSKPNNGFKKFTKTAIRRMRVAELRNELMQRQIDTNGTKPILGLRFINALDQEGLLFTRRMSRLTINNSRQSPAVTTTIRPSCKQELPILGNKTVDPSRTYALRILGKSASFSIDESGAGMVLRDLQTGEEVWAARQYFPTRRTSFETEYSAMIMALRHCREQGVCNIVLETNSAIVARQLTGRMVVSKPSLKKLYWQAMVLLISLENFEVLYFPKEPNSKESNLAEKAVATKRSIGLDPEIADPFVSAKPFQQITAFKDMISRRVALHGATSSIDATKLYVLRVDGGSRSKRACAGVGMVVMDENENEIWCGWQYLAFGISNNEAEYKALLLGLQCAASLGIRRLRAESDSELVIKQLRGMYQVKDQGLKPIQRKVVGLMLHFDYFVVNHIPRTKNARADELANHAMDERSSYGFDNEVDIQSRDSDSEAENPNEAAAFIKKSTDVDTSKPTLPVSREESTARQTKISRGSLLGAPIDVTKMYLLKVDGGSRNNPGSAGIGMVLYDENGDEIWSGWKYLGMGVSNNVAEYTSMVIGLRVASSLGIRFLQVETDSELVVKQVQGLYKVKNPGLKPLHQIVKKLEKQFSYIRIRHILRGDNARADELANRAMDEKNSYGLDDQ